MTNLVVGVDDWSALGVRPPADGALVLQLVKPILVDGRVITSEAWRVLLDAQGNGSSELPDIEAGNGVSVSPRFAGLPAFTIAGYAAAASITLVDAFASYRVDPESLDPIADAPDAWWTELTALQARVDEIDPSGPGAGGVTEEQLADAIAGLYAKPAGGIPELDLSASVKASLARADSALQAVPSAYTTDVELAAAIAEVTLASLGAQPAGSYAAAADLDNVFQIAMAAAPLASPHLEGVPTAPTAAPGTNSPQLANTAFVQAAIEALIAGAPGALDTLKEIADALSDDASELAALTTAIGTKVDKTRTVNGHALSADVVLTASDVGAAPTAHTHTSGQISDASTIGKAILLAADAAAVRSLIGAGTSSLVIGSTSTTAKAGDWTPTAAQISDGGAVGRNVVKAGDQTTLQQIVGLYGIASGGSVAGIPVGSYVIEAA